MFDACILDLASQVYIHLRAKLAQDLKICFGKNSAVAVAQNQILEAEIQKARKEAEDKGQVYKYTPLDQSKEEKLERAQFDKNMNELQTWAAT